MAEEPGKINEMRQRRQITPRMQLLADHAMFEPVVTKVSHEMRGDIPWAKKLLEGHDILFNVLRAARLPGIESEEESVAVNGLSDEAARTALVQQQGRVEEAAEQLYEYKSGVAARKEPADAEEEPIEEVITKLQGYRDHLGRIEAALSEPEE